MLAECLCWRGFCKTRRGRRARRKSWRRSKTKRSRGRRGRRGFLAVATGAAESGSARAAAACEKLGIADDEIIVNVQGDEPFIEPQIVAAVAARLADAADCACATAARPLAGKLKNGATRMWLKSSPIATGER